MGYEFLVIRTEVLDVNPLYGEDQFTGQFSKPTCAQLGLAVGLRDSQRLHELQSCGFYFRHAQHHQPRHRYRGQPPPARAFALRAGRFSRDAEAHAEPGLRWDFATPLYDRDNNYSNFDPATDTMVQATGGSLFNRSLVHPNYKDFGPRIGLAYSIDPKTVVRSGYGISYTFFNRPGSAEEGINAPQALFGVINQSIPAGRAGAGGLPHDAEQLYDRTSPIPRASIRSIPTLPTFRRTARGPTSKTGSCRCSAQLPENTVVELAYNGNHSLNLPILGDYNQAAPNAAGGTLGVQARRPIPTFGPITWVDPVGNNNYNGLSARVEHRFADGLYFLNSFTWGRALGDSEQALEYYAGYFEANPQNIHNLTAEYGPSSFDVKLNNVTSVVYQLPFGKGRKYGSRPECVGKMPSSAGGNSTPSTPPTPGTPLNVFYGPSTANDVTGLSNDYRGQAFQRPNVTGVAASQSTAAMINTYFAGYTFTTPPANAPFGDLGRERIPRSRLRAVGFCRWTSNFQIHEDIRLQFRSEFFNFLNHTNFGIPDTKTTDAAFGTIRTTYPARQIQFALKLLF